MEKQEAINLLYQASRHYKGTAKDHELLKEAAELLQALMTEPQKEEKEE